MAEVPRTIEEMPKPMPNLTEWTFAEWTERRLRQVQEIAPDYPVVELILELTSAGQKVPCADIRQRLGLTVGQMNAQLGYFTRRIKHEIAPEWQGLKWHWPFSIYPVTGRTWGYFMLPEIRARWQSLK
ncbi:MAG TPA: hypothetical protein VKB38_00885 [Terracidiphilus sp.]|nr:hypothetical protein [Terracidiphilus sp.]